MKAALSQGSSQRTQSSSVVQYALMVARTVSTTNTAGWDKIILSDADFPAGTSIQDILVLTQAPGLFNLKYNVRVEGALLPDLFVVGNTVINAVNDAQYHNGLANNRADFAVQTRMVLEVQVDSAIVGPHGTASFTIQAAVRLFT